MIKKPLFTVIAVGIAAVLGYIVIYKAAYVPATFDEVDTWYTYTGVRNIAATILNTGANTNNHILNSLLITVSQFFFGVKLWSLRLPNVLSFFAYAVSVLILARKYFKENLLLFCLPVACLFLNPYLLDFFSLARGYGMANAFMTCSITSLLIYSSSGKIRWYYLTILFAALAAYSNFAFLIFWVAVQILLLAIFLIIGHDRESIKIVLTRTVLMALAFMALCYAPLKSIQQCLQDNFANSGTFYQDVVLTEIQGFLYGKTLLGLSPASVSWFVYAVVLVGSIIFLLKIKSNLKSAVTDPFNLVFLLLIFVFIINNLQVYLSNTVYPGGRSGLMYYVLFIFVLIFLLREIYAARVFGSSMTIGLVLLLFIMNFTRNVTLKSVYEWSYDAYTNDVVNAIDDYRHRHPDTKWIELRADPCFQYSFIYYAKSNSLTWLTFHDQLDQRMINNLADTIPQVVFCYTSSHRAAQNPTLNVIRKFTATGLPSPEDIRDRDSIQTLYILKQ